MEYCDICGRPTAETAQFACDCADDYDVAPRPALRSAFDVSCQTCGETGSIEWVSLHSCQIAEQGGRCEDYPCCGHTDGDGCQTRPEHTADYWHRMRDHLGDERYEELDQMGYWDQMG